MTTPLKPLSAQAVVLTGATSGIGLATARLLAARGARLVLVARNESALKSLADELRAKGAEVEPVAADVADETALRRAAAVAEARFGGFDAWINNAGVLIYGRLSDVPLEDHRRLFETNYWGMVNGSRIAVEHLRGRPGGGVLLNVGSVLGDFPAPVQGVYCASKHALKGFTNALRMELLTDAPGVTVTLVKPSAIDTPISERSRSLLATAGSNPPPLYATPLVAEAIAHALTRRTRELTVGFGGRLLVWMGQLLSPVAEPLFSRIVPLLATKKGAPPGPGTLHVPGRDLRERGPYPVVRQSSVWLQAQMRPEVTVAVAGAAAMALWAALRLRRSLRDGAIRREVRADYDG